MEITKFWFKEEERKEQAPFASAPEATAAAQVKAGVGQGKKVLVVDDNLVVLKAFELKLKAAGFNVVTAADGSAAVSTTRKEKPDLILLDINFPPDVGMGWDGFVIVQWLRRQPENANIPIIIISSSETEKLKPKAIAAGAADFFQKPVDYPALMLRIQELLSGNDTPAAASVPQTPAQ